MEIYTVSFKRGNGYIIFNVVTLFTHEFYINLQSLFQFSRCYHVA